MRGPRGGLAQRLLRASSTAVSGDVPWLTSSPSQHTYDHSSIMSAGGRRDSDASSMCSSIPSSVGGRSSYSAATASSDRASYLRAVNSYLSSLSPPIQLKSPLPPARDITEALSRLLSRIDLDTPLPDLTRDLPPLLSALRCPIKLSKSAIKTPSTPHAWPSVISVLYWLVQLARLDDHLASSPSLPHLPDVHRHLVCCYRLYLSGDDCKVADMDAEYLERIERHAILAIKDTEALEAQVAQTESKLMDLSAAPSRLEMLEVERAALLEDAKKFQNVVDKFSGLIEEKKEKLAERETELETRVAEKMRLVEENEALRERIQGQALSTRDVERMKKELQVLERDISECESRRNEMDEKAWNLNSEAERKLREIGSLTEQCNQAIRKLKIGKNFQLVLNLKASSAAEIIGIDFKTLLKPSLTALADDAKKSKISKVEELINLQKQSHENDMMFDGNRAHSAAIQTKINEIEAQIDLLKKETEDHALICSSEAKKLKEELAIKEQEVDTLERSAQDLLMDSEEKLKRTTVECTGETQLCAQELYALIDSVSKYKECTCFAILEIKEEITEITQAVKLAFETSSR